MHSLVSVIVPVYNCEKYVSQCINSIISQSYSNIEIIAVDDGSTDNSGYILDELAKQDCRLQIIHNQNKGVSCSRNVGVSAAKGKYCVFIDADDFIHKEYIAYLVKLIESNHVSIAISSKCKTKSKEEIEDKDNVEILTAEDALALFLSPKLIVGCWNKIFCRDFLTENNIQFKPELFYGEGLHFICMAAQASNGVAVGSKKYYNYRRNNDDSATTQFSISKLVNGQRSLDIIASSIKIRTPKVEKMLNWHICQFNMGAVVKIRECGKQSEYREYYIKCLKYVRSNMWKIIGMTGISLYKKGLLVGCAISPAILTRLFSIRKNIIKRNSVN